jgi:drug/metabolite transporter (DMT)-like permease
MLALWCLGPWLLSPLTHQQVAPPPFAHVSVTAWVALACSGLLCTSAATLLWNWGLHHVPASRAGVFLNIEPALGAYLGVTLLGERLGPHALVGGALILGSAIFLSTYKHKSDPAIILE